MAWIDNNCTPELLRAVADNGSTSEQYWTLLKAADRIAVLESQLDRYRWRRVEEGMPEEGKWVLVFIEGDHVEAKWCGHDDGWFDAFDGIMPPTHWMPLPPAPEEGE